MNWNAVEPLVPLLLVNALFLAGLPIFWLRVKKHGLPVDDRIAHRRSVLGAFLQHYLLWLLGPVERSLVKFRVAPNTLTAISVLLSAGSAVALGMGHFGRGGWLFALTGITDILDGRVARATDRVSDAGAFADSVADRVAEALIYSGLAWYYRTSWVLLLVLVAFVASFLVSYTRARGEGLGVNGADIGAMQRPERILFLGLGLIFAPIVNLFLSPAMRVWKWPTVGALCLVGLASLGTTLSRFVLVYRSLQGRAPKRVRELRPLPKPPTETDPATVAETASETSASSTSAKAAT